MSKPLTNIEKVRRYITKYPEALVSEISHDLEIPKPTIYNYLKKLKIQRFANRAKIRMQSTDHVVSLNPLPDVFKSSRESETVDNVNHPSHYKVGGIETIDFIEAKELGYNLGNAIKYISRAKHKDSYVDDLKKAKWYLDREINNSTNI
jgi:hypothetical protein